MSYSLPDDSKKCGRCAWWEGSRHIEGTSQLWIDADMGFCSNPNATPGMSKCNTSFIWECPAFELWNRLR
jgi:hypothetical protein